VVHQEETLNGFVQEIARSCIFGMFYILNTGEI
jgi:hypothetical protein